jgi:c-di-GMP-binding flagellar brake protein YcgR
MRNSEKNRTASHCKALDAEKRKYGRIPLILPTEYLRTGSSITRFGHTINICEEGILICLPEKYEVGENLRVKVFFNMDFDCVCIDTRTEVVWSVHWEQKEKEYVCGLKFIEMSDGDLRKLKKFLKRFSEAGQDQKWLELFRLGVREREFLKKK